MANMKPHYETRYNLLSKEIKSNLRKITAFKKQMVTLTKQFKFLKTEAHIVSLSELKNISAEHFDINAKIQTLLKQNHDYIKEHGILEEILTKKECEIFEFKVKKTVKG